MSFENELDFALVVGFWFLASIVALAIISIICELLANLIDKIKHSNKREPEYDKYIDLMYQDWREHPEHAQGRKLPEEKASKY